jgi:D-3-phosphoglycerate dehydrogenase / 2-oxoglutarate reductase
VTYVNAPQLAADRGVEVELATSEDAGEHSSLITVRGALPDGRPVAVAGAAGKLVEVDGFELDLPADGVLLLFRYRDHPGVVGRIGTTLGRAGVNIAAMQVARRAAGGEALMTLTVDSSVGPDLLAEVAAEIDAAQAAAVDLRGD